MRHFNEWTESYLNGILWDIRYDLFERRLGSPALIQKLETLFSPFEHLMNQSTSAQYGVEYYEFYFRLPRGTYEQSEYAEYEDVDESEEKDYRESFQRGYRKKWYWHTISFSRDHYRGDVFYTIRIGHHTTLNVSDGKGDDATRNLRMVEDFEWVEPLQELLQELMQSLRDGTYESFVSANLDHEMREGEIQYQDFWRLYPSEGKKHFRNYKGVDLDLFRKYAQEGVFSQERATHFKRLCANDYCRYFCIGANAVNIKTDEKASFQERYLRASDGRTLDLHLIDGDSLDDFDAWYDGQRYGFDHAFEYRYCKNAERADLRIEKDEGGYYFEVLCGPSSDVGVRIALALANEGVFVRLSSPESYISFYEGTNYRSVDSQENYFGHEFPRSKRKAFIEAVRWEPLDLIRLKEEV